MHTKALRPLPSMLAAGISLPVVAARLGHARVSTTLNVYAASMPAWTERPPKNAQRTLTRKLISVLMAARISHQTGDAIVCAPTRRNLDRSVTPPTSRASSRR